nr:vegetative cell wall protein gp1-like [Pelodiscus sinensis]|eukprot:XP_025044417.1 vegetative cell wall protein gp1-like [Pelodiscus sinensis]
MACPLDVPLTRASGLLAHTRHGLPTGCAPHQGLWPARPHPPWPAHWMCPSPGPLACSPTPAMACPLDVPLTRASGLLAHTRHGLPTGCAPHQGLWPARPHPPWPAHWMCPSPGPLACSPTPAMACPLDVPLTRASGLLAHTRHGLPTGCAPHQGLWPARPHPPWPAHWMCPSPGPLACSPTPAMACPLDVPLTRASGLLAHTRHGLPTGCAPHQGLWPARPHPPWPAHWMCPSPGPLACSPTPAMACPLDVPLTRASGLLAHTRHGLPTGCAPHQGLWPACPRLPWPGHWMCPSPGPLACLPTPAMAWALDVALTRASGLHSPQSLASPLIPAPFLPFVSMSVSCCSRAHCDLRRAGPRQKTTGTCQATTLGCPECPRPTPPLASAGTAHKPPAGAHSDSGPGSHLSHPSVRPGSRR